MFTFLQKISIVTAIVIFSAGMTSAAPALSPSFTSESRLASGKWVKIRVDNAGIYRIDYATLADWGFSDPAKVGVYGSPAVSLLSQSFIEETPDDISPVAAYHRDDALYFYGEADISMRVDNLTKITVTRNHYDLHSYYFLHQDDEPLAPRFNEFVEADDAEIVSDAVYVDYIENEVQNPVYGGIFFHDRRLTPGESVRFNFNIKDYAGTASAPGFMSFDYACYRGTSGPFAPVLDNGKSPVTYTPLQEVLRPSYTNSTSYYSWGGMETTFTPGAPDVVMTARLSVPATFAGDYYAFDNILVSYRRTLRMRSDAERFYLPGLHSSKVLAIAEADAGSEVWEVYSDGSVVRNEVRSDDRGALVRLSSGFYSKSSTTPVVLFRPGLHNPAPVYVGEVASQNLHADTTPDYLIITTESLRDAAEELAGLHRVSQSIEVKVVTQEDIFNEFSSGARMPQALRRYAKMLYDRSPGKLRWILLYGASTYDNRGINADVSSLLVSFQSETRSESTSESTNYCGDQYFGMLESNYNHNEIYRQPMSVAVGRIPVRSAAQAREMNAKIGRVLASPMNPVYARRALFSSDRGDSYAHYDHCREAIAATGDFFHSIDHVALEAYPLENKIAEPAGRRWLRQLNAGVGYLSYNGHGSPIMLTSSDMLNPTHIDKMSGSVYPLGVFASCKVFDFDSGIVGLGEQMLLRPDGGLIGLVAAARSVILSPNRLANVYMAREFASATPGTTYGEVFKNARNALIAVDFEAQSEQSARNPAINFMCYNYGGDPAIPLPLTDDDISLRFNAIGNSGSGIPTVTPNIPTRIDFDIVDADGNTVAADGTATVAVYRTPIELSFKRDKADTPDIVPVHGDFLALYNIAVEGGHASADIIVPDDNAVSESNLCVASFVADDGRAAVTDGLVRLVPGSASPADVAAPVITDIWAEGVDDKDAAPASFTVMARVRPGGAGIASGIGHPGLSPACLVDGGRSLSTTVGSRTDGNDMLFSVNLKNLSDGRHEVLLRVSDYLGNKTEETFAFTVQSQPLAATLALGANHAPGEPVREQACFDLAFDSDELPEATLIVRDRNGNTVRRMENMTAGYTWDLTDADGNTVPDGEYSAFMMLRRAGSYGATNTVRFVVLAPIGQ